MADPDVVRDMFTSKNAQLDLVEGGQHLLVDLLGETSTFSPTVAAWRSRSEACAHVSYKERMVHMMNTLEDKI